MGGEDDPFQNATRRDALVPEKTVLLAEKFRALFPRIDLNVDYAWAGITMACLLGIALYVAVSVAERLVIRWTPSTSE